MGEEKKGSVSIITLGCKVNQYESQQLKEQFASAGYIIDEEEQLADIYIINTCSVTNLSDRKSRQLIRKAIRKDHGQIVAVTGCLAQIKPQEIANIPGVNIVAGTNEKNNLFSYIENYRKERTEHIQIKVKDYDELKYYDSGKSITGMGSRTRAYIKIQEGCDRFCSYCIIPYARGNIRSRNLEEIVDEAEGLINNGFKEIVLTGINTALYGKEQSYSKSIGGSGVEIVIRALNELPGEFRIRLGSLEPTVVDSKYAYQLLGFKKLCPHMHLSMQSGSDRILKLMNRNYNTYGYQGIVDILRNHDPGFGITTDIIVGFPGEEDEDFEETLNIVKSIGFNKVHIFPYSEREGTKAANLVNKISVKIKNERTALLAEAAEMASAKFFESCIGQTRLVLFERYDPMNNSLEGYTDNYIRVYCEGHGDLVNEFARVRLTGVFGDTMQGEIVK